jgi:hypothetical protein
MNPNYLALYSRIFIPAPPDYLALYSRIFTKKDVDLNDYLELYKRIFVFDQKLTSPYRVDLSKLDINSIYVNVFSKLGQKPSININTAGLNFGDGHSYVDFEKHPDGTITFYRRNQVNNKLLPMKYTRADNKLAVIVNGTRHELGAIIDELQSVLDQISTMPDPQL